LYATARCTVLKFSDVVVEHWPWPQASLRNEDVSYVFSSGLKSFLIGFGFAIVGLALGLALLALMQSKPLQIYILYSIKNYYKSALILVWGLQANPGLLGRFECMCFDVSKNDCILHQWLWSAVNRFIMFAELLYRFQWLCWIFTLINFSQMGRRIKMPLRMGFETAAYT